MRFSALDFETANQYRTSVCSVGIVSFENGKEVSSFYSLVKPSPFEFSSICSSIHGIYHTDVYDAPSFSEIYPEILKNLNGYIVCHGASFDISCLNALISLYGLEHPRLKVLCTLKLARKFLKLPKNKLNNLAEHFNLGDFNHHNALDDARTCGKILVNLSKEEGFDSEILSDYF